MGDLTAAPSPEACPEGHTEGRGCPGGSRCPGPLCRVRRALAPDGRPLTHGQPHQAVGEEAGGQEGGPQRDVQLPRDLRLDPREQAAREGEAQQTGPQPRAHPPRAHPAPGTPRPGRAGTHFLIFSRMSAIFPKRFCVKKQPWSRQTPGALAMRETRSPRDLSRRHRRAPGPCPAAPGPRTTNRGAGHQTRPGGPPPATLSWCPRGTSGQADDGVMTTDRPGPGLWPQPDGRTWAFWATSSTSWNFSDTVRSSFGGSFSQRGKRISTEIQQFREITDKNSMAGPAAPGP